AAHNFLGDLAYLRELVVRKEQPAAYLNHMTMIIGLADFYRQQKRPFMALDEAGFEVLLDVLITVAGSCSSLHAFYEWLDGALAEGARPAPAADPGGVLLSTIHAAKGREFPCVILYHFNGPGSCPEEEIEEERRVAYVGATRAGEELLVLGPAGTPGLFMSEFAFDPELAAFSDRRLADEIGRLGRKQPRARKQETEAAARLQAMAEELARRSALGFHK
ncbi:MAG TPA: 3'-5' exonuclease, partial [bacterium]|nr:3'-5' exonuclease [bacterium]